MKQEGRRATDCSSCGTRSPLEIRIHDRNRRITTEIFSYYRCPGCGLLFLAPIPRNLGDYYAGDYYGGAPTRQRLERAARLERYKIEIVNRFLPEGRLLEIGPSYGAFALIAREAGFEVDTIELDADCCEFLREVVGVRATQTADPVKELDGSGERYDVIAMWHNLEHVPNAHELFRVSAGALRPGGVLVIAAPNPDAFQFSVLGSRWTHLDAPRHVLLMPISRLEKWASEEGLRPVWITTRDRGSLEWNAFGWRETFAASSRNRFLRFGLRILGSLVAVLAMPIERRERRGATYTAVMRKES